MFIIIVITALATPKYVLAQDAIPTDALVESTEVVVEEPVVEETGAPTEAPLVEETGAPTEAPLVEETAVPTKAPVVVETAVPTEAPVVEEAVAEIVEVLTTEEIIIVDENGDELPMASQEAADVISNSDPFFWNGSQWIGYTSMTGTCPSFVAVCNQVAAPFTTALTVIPENSTLYVQSGYYDEEVTVSTSGLSFMAFNTISGVADSSVISSYTDGFASIRALILNAAFNATYGVYADEITVMPNGYLSDALMLANPANLEATITADVKIVDGGTNVQDANHSDDTKYEWECGEPNISIDTSKIYRMVLKNPKSAAVLGYYGTNANDEINDLIIGASMSEQITLSFMDPDLDCPPGFSESGGVCTKNPACQPGHTSWDGKCWYYEWGWHESAKNYCSSGTYNSSTQKCERAGTPVCPSGTTYNSGSGKCDLPAWSNQNEQYEFWKLLNKSHSSTDLTNPIFNYIQDFGTSVPITQKLWFLWPVGQGASNPTTCAHGSLLNGFCVDQENPCSTGYSYDATQNLCVKSHSPECDYRYSYNSSTNKCERSGYSPRTPSCDSGYSLNTVTDKCEKTKSYSCDSGYTINGASGKCEKNYGAPTCRSGERVSPTSGMCEKIVSPSNTQLTFLKLPIPQTGCTDPALCPLPACEFNPDIPYNDPECPAPCEYNSEIPSTDANCAPIVCTIGDVDYISMPEGYMAVDTEAGCAPIVCTIDNTDYASMPDGYMAVDTEAGCAPIVCTIDNTDYVSMPDGYMAVDTEAGCAPIVCTIDNADYASMPEGYMAVDTEAGCAPIICTIDNVDYASMPEGYMAVNTEAGCAPIVCTIGDVPQATVPIGMIVVGGVCVTPVSVTTPTPALAIPVTGGALIPVTGGTLIVSGLGHSCMTYNNGQVVCWGLNESGQLGDGTTVDKSEAVYVKNLTGVFNLTAGSKHTCALTASGEIWCWGENSSGQLGDGSTTNSSIPVKVTGLPDQVLSITAGEEFTCAQLMNQEVWCWGKNNLGQLNDGTTTNQTSPVKSKLTAMLAQISGGQGLLLGSDVLGSVSEWVKAQAEAVKLLENSLSISANRWGETGCAVSADGSVKCWGSDLTSALVVGALPALEVGSGLDHNCSINSDQTVSCWGSNGSGQLGNGTNKDSDSATLVKNLALTRALAVGAHHTCVLSGTGYTAMCWGENTYGQLGNGTTSNSNVPVLVVLPK
jgi:hypothetical protein